MLGHGVPVQVQVKGGFGELEALSWALSQESGRPAAREQQAKPGRQAMQQAALRACRAQRCADCQEAKELDSGAPLAWRCRQPLKQVPPLGCGSLLGSGMKPELRCLLKDVEGHAQSEMHKGVGGLVEAAGSRQLLMTVTFLKMTSILVPTQRRKQNTFDVDERRATTTKRPSPTAICCLH